MSSLPLKYDAQGLVPAIVQDHLTGEIRMFAFASDAAVRMTLDTGRATFWSRSRGELWQRARVSGNEIPVVRVLADCDGDCVIYSSDPHSPTCHSGAPSCFFQAFDGDRLGQSSAQPQTLLAALESALETRRKSIGFPGSVDKLADAGPAAAAAKMRAEANQFTEALEKESDERVVSKAADTVYQLLVGLRARSISLRRVFVELSRRLATQAAIAGK